VRIIKALGPDRQLLVLPAGRSVTGRFELDAEDGLTLLGTSAQQAARSGQTFVFR
jgi:hypothetical protein